MPLKCRRLIEAAPVRWVGSYTGLLSSIEAKPKLKLQPMRPLS